MFVDTVNTGVCGSNTTPYTEYYEVWKLCIKWSTERAYVNTVDTCMQIWVEHFEFPDEKPSVFSLSDPDCQHCWHKGSSSTDVVLLKTESKERAYVDTVDTCMQIWVEHFEFRMKSLPYFLSLIRIVDTVDTCMQILVEHFKFRMKSLPYFLSLIWIVDTVDTCMQILVEHFEFQMKSLPDCWHCQYKAHLVLMLYYWRHRANKKSIHACNEIRSHTNSFHCICRHCRYKQDTPTQYTIALLWSFVLTVLTCPLMYTQQIRWQWVASSLSNSK